MQAKAELAVDPHKSRNVLLKSSLNAGSGTSTRTTVLSSYAHICRDQHDCFCSLIHDTVCSVSGNAMLGKCITHLDEIAIICGATFQPILYLKLETLRTNCAEGSHMLGDRRDLHLVNLDLLFLGQVLQVGKRTPCLCTPYAVPLASWIYKWRLVIESRDYFGRG